MVRKVRSSQPRKSQPKPKPKPQPRRNPSNQQSKRKPWTSGLLGSVGGALGSTVGMPGLGRAAGDWLGKITGLGTYKVDRNTLMSNSIPQFAQVNEGVDIAHREYLCDITSSTQFSSLSFAINPGQSATFPWLSTIAANFQQYCFKGLVFEFKSTSANSVASTNTALGTVILSTQYDPNALPFSTKASMEQYEYTVSTSPAHSVIHPIECKPSLNVLSELFVRTAAPSGDLRLQDLGNFQIATIGSQAACDVGELWVTYHVRFFKPQFFAPTLSQPMTARISTTSATASAPMNLALQIGTLPIQVSSYGAFNTNTQFVLPYTGNYFIITAANGSVSGTNILTFGQNITAVSGGMVVSGTQFATVGGGTEASISTLKVTIAGTGAANVVTLPTYTGLGGSFDLFVVYTGTYTF